MATKEAKAAVAADKAAEQGFIRWSETPVAGANVHLGDGVLGYWATVPATWTEAQVRAVFLETADYDEVPRIAVTLREGNEGAACFTKCARREG